MKDVIKLSADLRKKDCKKEAKELCERLGLDTEKKVEELSFGNRKKVAIVCALQHKPRLCCYSLSLQESALEFLLFCAEEVSEQDSALQ